MMAEDKNRSLFIPVRQWLGHVQVTAFVVPDIELVLMTDYFGRYVNSADNCLGIELEILSPHVHSKCDPVHVMDSL